MPNSHPVLLLSIDTLRADRFTDDCFPESMPVFERDFVTFSNALSHGNATPLAFPSITTSHHVVGDGRFPNDATPIAELFTDRPCAGFSNNGHLTAEREYDRGFDMFHDLVTPDSKSVVDRLKGIELLRESDLVVSCYNFFRNAVNALWNRNVNSALDPFPNPKTTADDVTDFVERRLAANPQSFVWVHYMDPHKPFHPDQAVDGPNINRSREEIKELNDYKHEKDPIGDDDMKFLEALYDSNIRYCDRELNRLFRQMKREGWYDDALIVVVGDHGELFGEHDMMFHPMDIDPVDELLRTPLLVKYPDGKHAGKSFDHLVQHADILPTIADVMDIDADVPEHAYPVTNTTLRSVISKSNVSIRLTEEDGIAYKRRNGTEDRSGDLSEFGLGLLADAEFPNVKTSSGEVKGVEEAERQKQLEALGYR